MNSVHAGWGARLGWSESPHPSRTPLQPEMVFVFANAVRLQDMMREHYAPRELKRRVRREFTDPGTNFPGRKMRLSKRHTSRVTYVEPSSHCNESRSGANGLSREGTATDFGD